MGQVTPYATFAHSQRVHTPKVDVSRAGGDPVAAFLLTAAQGAVDSNFFEQDSVTLGFRWDLKSNAAWKLQASRVMPGKDSVGTLINTTADFVTGNDYTLVSATVDFVF
jgi:hypothetical protein